VTSSPARGRSTDARPDDPDAPTVRTRIVLLAGPSGSGKSSLAAHVGLPTVCLDDFYKDGDDTSLPHLDLPGPDGQKLVDWDDPRSWHAHRAHAALVELALTGAIELPVYDIPTSRAIGTHRVDVGDAPLVVAEGIFAAELVDACRDAGILADALCLTLRPSVTFWRRLVRDLRESRKPPLTLVRRGLALLRAEPSIVARQVSLGADPVSPDDAVRRLRRLADEAGAERAADDLAA
jgi:uridine kinase